VCPKLLIFGLEGELFFGAAVSLERHLDSIEHSIVPDTRVIVLRMKRARNPDAVCLHMLSGFLERMKSRGVEVLMCGVRSELLASLDKSGLRAELGEGCLFPEQAVRQTSTLLAIRHAYTLIAEPCATCPRRDPSRRDQDLYYAV
jgi:SulP family sulfate permease